MVKYVMFNLENILHNKVYVTLASKFQFWIIIIKKKTSWKVSTFPFNGQSNNLSLEHWSFIWNYLFYDYHWSNLLLFVNQYWSYFF